MLLPWDFFPGAGLNRSLDTGQPSLLEVLIALLRELAEYDYPVPFRGFPAIPAVISVRGQAEV